MNKKKYYKTKEFAKIQAKWYKKLSKSGFVDLEWTDKNSGAGHSTPFLRKSLNKFKHLHSSELLEKASYFVAAAAWADCHKFPTRLHQFIWECYAEGLSYRNMQAEIKSRGYKKQPSLFWISTHLNQLKSEFALWYAETYEQPKEDLESFMRSNRNDEF